MPNVEKVKAREIGEVSAFGGGDEDVALDVARGIDCEIGGLFNERLAVGRVGANAGGGARIREETGVTVSVDELFRTRGVNFILKRFPTSDRKTRLRELRIRRGVFYVLVQGRARKCVINSYTTGFGTY